MKTTQILLITLSPILSFLMNANAATSDSKAPNFMGDYTQRSGINFAGAEDKKTCLAEAPDGEWSDNTCYAKATNSIGLSRESDVQDKYLVQISIIGGNVHTCDFTGEMTLRDNKLVYEDVIPDEKSVCKIELEQVANGGLKIVAGDVCSEYYCGFGLVLSGTNQVFARTGDGHEITHELAVKRTQE